MSPAALPEDVPSIAEYLGGSAHHSAGFHASNLLYFGGAALADDRSR